MGAARFFPGIGKQGWWTKLSGGLRLVGWCLTALSAQKGYIVPWEK